MSQLFTTPPRLTQRQQLVYELLAEYGNLSAQEAGLLLHESTGCRYCRPDSPCKYAEANGREVLNALKRKGLLRRDRRHVYRRTDQPSDTSSPGYDPATADWPEGF